MSIEPVEGVGAVDGPSWTAPVEAVGEVAPVDAAAPAPDLHAAALQVARHATAFIPGPLPWLPTPPPRRRGRG